VKISIISKLFNKGKQKIYQYNSKLKVPCEIILHVIKYMCENILFGRSSYRRVSPPKDVT